MLYIVRSSYRMMSHHSRNVLYRATEISKILGQAELLANVTVLSARLLTSVPLDCPPLAGIFLCEHLAAPGRIGT